MIVQTYGLDSYNQTITEEKINPLRSSEGGDTKPMIVVVKDDEDSDRSEFRRIQGE